MFERISPFIIVIIASSISIWIAFWSRKNAKIDDRRDKLDNRFGKKVDIDDCLERHIHIQNFKERLGRESDGHRKSINRLEKGMIFLVQKQDGDPSAMGLMD